MNIPTHNGFRESAEMEEQPRSLPHNAHPDCFRSGFSNSLCICRWVMIDRGGVLVPLGFPMYREVSLVFLPVHEENLRPHPHPHRLLRDPSRYGCLCSHQDVDSTIG